MTITIYTQGFSYSQPALSILNELKNNSDPFKVEVDQKSSAKNIKYALKR